jgi:chromosome partitioning protein
MQTTHGSALDARFRATPDEPSQDQPSADAEIASLKVVAFTSRKGGSGKTTLCGQLAVQADLAGAGPVALVDTDPQGSLAEWWNARQAETPVFVKTSLDRLSADLDRLREQGVRLVFIDTAPAATECLGGIVRHADLVIVPTRPSPHDLRAVGGTIDVVTALNRPLIFAVNGATRRARITAEAAVALSQHGTVAPVTLHQRVDFATSMIDGRAVMELDPGSPSATEVADLWRYVAGRLGKLERRRQRLPFVGREQRRSAQGEAPARQRPRAVFGRRVYA